MKSAMKVTHLSTKPRLHLGNKEVEKIIITADGDDLLVEADHRSGRTTLSSCPQQEALLFTEDLMSNYDVPVDASQLKGVPLTATIRKKAHTADGPTCYAEGKFSLGDANEAYELVGRTATVHPGLLRVEDRMKYLEIQPDYVQQGVKKYEENMAWFTLFYRVATGQVPLDLAPEGVCPLCFSRFFIIESGQCQECHYARLQS